MSYHVVEEFPKAVADQERVAACFVQGARWQFKGWPIPGVDRGDMVECFHRICGFYLRFNDEKVPQASIPCPLSPVFVHVPWQQLRGVSKAPRRTY